MCLFRQTENVITGNVRIVLVSKGMETSCILFQKEIDTKKDTVKPVHKVW